MYIATENIKLCSKSVQTVFDIEKVCKTDKLIIQRLCIILLFCLTKALILDNMTRLAKFRKHTQK